MVQVLRLFDTPYTLLIMQFEVGKYCVKSWNSTDFQNRIIYLTKKYSYKQTDIHRETKINCYLEIVIGRLRENYKLWKTNEK